MIKITDIGAKVYPRVFGLNFPKPVIVAPLIGLAAMENHGRNVPKRITLSLLYLSQASLVMYQLDLSA